jgi:hypothetical protein
LGRDGRTVCQRTTAVLKLRQNTGMDISPTRRKPPPAAYALHRQMRAVQRCMTASTVEESIRATRWASAWYRLVQRKLDQLQHAPRYRH